MLAVVVAFDKRVYLDDLMTIETRLSLVITDKTAKALTIAYW